MKEKEKGQQSWRWRICKAGLTMRDFATRIGRTQSQLSEWVNDRKKAGPESIALVENELKKLGV